MRRPGSGKQLETIQRWRSICPELVIRSTFIVGFPGETEEDFQMLLDFLSAAELDRVGCFTYSEVEEADATHFEGLVPEEVKQERYERLMALQQEISERRMQRHIGKEIEVVIDDYNEEPGQLIGRSIWDAPDIDGNVFCVHGKLAETKLARKIKAGTIKIGDRVKVLVEEVDAYDIFGEVVAVLPWEPKVPQRRT
jgi:ribosomal protein S12 methylthiotransferase